MTNPPMCPKCSSEDITAPSVARWDVKSQKWVSFDTLEEYCICGDCYFGFPFIREEEATPNHLPTQPRIPLDYTGLTVLTTEPLGVSRHRDNNGFVILPAGSRCTVKSRDTAPDTWLLTDEHDDEVWLVSPKQFHVLT